MNIFDLLGYRSDRPYSVESKTNVGYFSLVNGGSTHSYNLSASSGTYVVTGQAANFNKSVSLSSENGSYAITGQDATFSLTKAYSLAGANGSYAITGQDATFDYNPAVLTNLETLIKLRSFTEHRRF